MTHAMSSARWWCAVVACVVAWAGVAGAGAGSERDELCRMRPTLCAPFDDAARALRRNAKSAQRLVRAGRGVCGGARYLVESDGFVKTTAFFAADGKLVSLLQTSDGGTRQSWGKRMLDCVPELIEDYQAYDCAPPDLRVEQLLSVGISERSNADPLAPRTRVSVGARRHATIVPMVPPPPAFVESGPSALGPDWQGVSLDLVNGPKELVFDVSMRCAGQPLLVARLAISVGEPDGIRTAKVDRVEVLERHAITTPVEP